MNTWVELTGETSYAATTTAEQRAESSINTYFSFCLTPAFTNAFLLYKHFSPTVVLKVLKDFRLQLAKDLIANHCSRRRAGRGGGAILPLPFLHFPLKQESDSNPSKRKRGRCAHCSQSKKRTSSWYFRECDVWLCHTGDPTKDCFLAWHKKRQQ